MMNNTLRVCEILGIASSDVKEIWQFVDRDIIGIKLWNHRNLRLTGYEYSKGKRVL